MPRIIRVLPLLFAVPAMAPARASDLNAELAHCMILNGAAERLSCYDRVAHDVVRTAPTAQARAGSAVDPERDFGKEQLHSAEGDDDRMTAEIADFRKDQRDHFTVALQNGQVWRQVAGDTDIAQFRSGSTHQVTISRGALGSYDLRFNDRNATFKVQRLR